MRRLRRLRAMLKKLARFILWLGGWRAVGAVPDVPKAVVIAAPHTSNWDALWALSFKTAIGLDIRFFAKDTLFWFPLGALLRSLGGIPLDRSRAGSAVKQAVAMFAEEESFYFGLAPEGTRALRDAWKSGFYRIATAADVPVFLGVLDYENKTVGIMGRLDLTGDAETDIAECADFYRGFKGCWPEKTTPVRFAK
jgi:1-acyl-sn-glycerol-3-phosphate acyltransferase